MRSYVKISTRSIDEEDRPFTPKIGFCEQVACSEDAACKQFENGTYFCLCTHDSKPPMRNGTCPRNIVSVPSPGRIPNVQPPSNKHQQNNLQQNVSNSSEPMVQNSETPSPLNSSVIMLASLGIVFLLLSMALLIGYRRKRIKRNNNIGSPINLKHSLLMAERYAPNPQYSACSGAGVAVLHKDSLRFLSEIGEGCFGKVYKGEFLPEDSDKTEIVAIKVLKETASREAEEDFLREVEIMSAFRHPNILLLLGVVLREGNVSPMMVFEYMPHGDLAELLRAQQKTDYDSEVPRLNHIDLLFISLQIANGMKYLAAQRFVHRDLACRNCLVSEGPTVKIADFGMSRDVYTCDYYKIGGSRLLPVRWMSPESVVYGRFTLESDIWSFGVVLWEIYSFGKQPYYGHTNEEVVKLILDGIMLIPPDDCPSLICELMKNCWKTEPKHRITFSHICDKLELAYESALASKEKADDVEIEVDRESYELSVGNADFTSEGTAYKKNVNANERSQSSLPRPPAKLPQLPYLPNLHQQELLDAHGYLLPNRPDPVSYLEL